MKDYGINDGKYNPEIVDSPKRDRYSSQPIKLYSRKGDNFATNKTMRFDGESNFVPLEEFGGDSNNNSNINRVFNNNPQMG